jgi:aspartyl-tRNA(Asn)/glutamyl-tRNA(Gln) amidotransferase subunit A
MTNDPCHFSMSDQARLLASGELSSVALTQAHLDRIYKLDGQLNSFITVAEAQAMNAARASDQRRRKGEQRGPIDGLTVGIKDLIDVAGLPTTAAAAHRRDHIALQDAPVVAALRHAGAVILGKTTTAEYAVGGTTLDGPFPAARNPWGLDRDASSSSSGSAASVAAGLAAGAVGTETAGSIRVPAAWCGVAGLVPTQALVSRQGVLPVSQTMDCVGPLARSAADCSVLLQAMIAIDPAENTAKSGVQLDKPRLNTPIDGLSIGVPRHIFEDDPDLNPDVRAAFAATLDQLRYLGCRLSDVVLQGYDSWGDAARKISWPEEYAAHGAELRDHPDRFGPVTRLRLQEGLKFTAPDYVLASRQREIARQTLADMFHSVDLLVLPTTKTPAQPFGYEHLPGARDFTYSRPFNLAGNPMLALCNGLSSSGLPLSVQFIGRPFNDNLVLAAGIALENLSPDQRPLPPLYTVARCKP